MLIKQSFKLLIYYWHKVKYTYPTKLTGLFIVISITFTFIHMQIVAWNRAILIKNQSLKKIQKGY